MKHTFLIIMGLVLLIHTGWAQPEKKISIQAQGQTLAQILAEIESKSGIRFSYNPRKIAAERKLDFQITNQSVSEVLRTLGSLANLDFEQVENQMIISPRNKTASIEPQFATLSGYIKDSKNGEALIGATLLLPALQTGAITNSFGFFSITLPIGPQQIKISYIGYQIIETAIELTTSMKLDFQLQEDLPLLDAVIVTALPEFTLEQAPVSQLIMRPEAVEERPALFGEMDVIKSLESVPGIKLHSDGSTFYYVRGGNRDQNLILIDDAPIYNPSHMLGLFSTIIPDAATDITLYKGNMPASFGGRLSSVLDIHTRKGNDRFTQVWGNVNLISTKLGIEGPIKKESSSYLISGRFSRLKWLFQLAEPSINQFSFHDITGKVNVKLNSRNHTYFSFYTGADNYFSGNNGIKWINRALTMRFTNQYSKRLFIHTTLAASGYDYSLYTDVSRNQRWNSQISNVGLKSDFSYFPKPENEISFGAAFTGYNFNPGNVTTNGILNSNVSARHSLEFILYGNQNLRLNKWGFNYGMRLTSWTNVGEAFEFRFDENHAPIDTLFYNQGDAYINFLNLEPRAMVEYHLKEGRSLKFGYGRHAQNIHLVSNSISPFTSLEVWLPSSINIKPQLANQLTLGYYHLLGQHGIALSSELFFKKMRNQIDFETHAETLLNPFFESELRFGSSTAYGLELLAKKDLGRLRGMTGYTYSRVRRNFAELNNGQSYNALFDRPHQINVTLSYDLNERWLFGASWNFLSGATYSAPVSFYQFNGLDIPIYSQKNNARLPAYHRLDVNATLKLNRNPEKKFQHDLTFSVFNLYGRKNPLFINFNKQEVAFRDFKVPSNLIESQQSISQFYLFQVAPSVSYNFRWR